MSISKHFSQIIFVSVRPSYNLLVVIPLDEVKARQLQGQAEAAVTEVPCFGHLSTVEANKELLLTTLNAAEAASASHSACFFHRKAEAGRVSKDLQRVLEDFGSPGAL